MARRKLKRLDEDIRIKLAKWITARRKSVVRPRHREPRVQTLHGPRHRRAARRFSRHQPAYERSAARCAGEGLHRERLPPKAHRPADPELARLPVVERAERNQPGRHAELLALLREAAAGRRADRLDDRSHRRARKVSGLHAGHAGHDHSAGRADVFPGRRSAV